MKIIRNTLLAFLLMFTFVIPASTANYYAVKRANITTSSVSLSFGFRASIVQIQSDSSNTDEICIDWKSGTAACPSANTAGDDVLPIGFAITLDNYKIPAISVIAASGTQTIFIRAWR